jgi:hypothetical protein
VTFTREQLGALFGGFSRSAFRMETHQVYAMPTEADELSWFLEGQPLPDGFNSGWHETIRRNLAAGKTMQRLKVVRRPFTDYTRFLFEWAIPGNVEAGEDYRILDATDRDTGIPEQDFWLFDESAVALLNFNPDGTLRDREQVDESELEKYLHWRDVALAESVPFVEYRV